MSEYKEIPKYEEPPDIIIVIKKVFGNYLGIPGLIETGITTNRQSDESNEALAERVAVSLKELLLNELNSQPDRKPIDLENFFPTRDIDEILDEFMEKQPQDEPKLPDA